MDTEREIADAIKDIIQTHPEFSDVLTEFLTESEAAGFTLDYGDRMFLVNVVRLG